MLKPIICTYAECSLPIRHEIDKCKVLSVTNNECRYPEERCTCTELMDGLQTGFKKYYQAETRQQLISFQENIFHRKEKHLATKDNQFENL